MKHLKRLIIFMLIISMTLGVTSQFFSPVTLSTEAASKNTVKYTYKGKKKTFTGTKRKVLYNSKAVSLTKTPVIVMSGCHMTPYYETFVKGSVKAKKSYDKKTKTIVLTANSHTVQMKVNSKTAYIDGKKTTLSVSPKMITYTSSKLTRIMVPMKFTAEALGLTYSWNKIAGTIKLKQVTTSNNNNTASSGGTSTTASSIETTTESTSESTTAAVSETTVEEKDTTISNFAYTIKVKRPFDVSKGSITCTDDYNNKRLKISMNGDYSSFYTSNKPSMPSGVTFRCSYSAGKTTLSFTTKKIKGFEVKEDGNYIYIKHGSPTKIYKNVIVIDAGHGGSDTGATGNGYKEKNMTLAIVQAAKKYFDENSNYKVYYTRLTDKYPSLADRYNLANEVKSDLFISVHINSAGKTATGTETLYNPDRNKKSSAGLSC
ncbi:MAG: N-acetylmuramoyl-L-alanine amidase, partial [Lachnospiraceae bacterium]|nr:N-acetylmuramoyl-L-alanine amidase [Lachnospiraceae bacterium]